MKVKNLLSTFWHSKETVLLDTLKFMFLNQKYYHLNKIDVMAQKMKIHDSVVEWKTLLLTDFR